ncbi:adenylyl-sulfate kinase [uncultured Aquimonas sp.]|uniref:adenylyl-sulfate kinase n=1 Tax=uncultured Aquimonas sp. TaxID=385483 RepID=UPI002613BEB0|nr:adenylyl-sulfate kinase [uncultured Aquimonas sp.]
MDGWPERVDASDPNDLRLHALWREVQTESPRYAMPAAQWGATRAPLLWITGLAGSGKTTLGRALQTHLAEAHAPVLLLDGDALRTAFDSVSEEQPHAPTQRRARARRLLTLAHAATRGGLPAVVATISLQQEIHTALRASQSQLGLLVLQAPLDLLRQRRPELYADPAMAAQVVGLGQRADWPRAPAQVISALLPLADQRAAALALWARLRERAGAASMVANPTDAPGTQSAFDPGNRRPREGGGPERLDLVARRLDPRLRGDDESTLLAESPPRDAVLQISQATRADVDA